MCLPPPKTRVAAAEARIPFRLLAESGSENRPHRFRFGFDFFGSERRKESRVLENLESGHQAGPEDVAGCVDVALNQR